MEASRSSSHVTQGNQRVPHTFSNQTSSFTPQKSWTLSDSSVRGHVREHISNDSTRCAGGSTAFSEFYLNYVLSPQRRRYQSADIQFKKSELSCRKAALQTCKRCSSTKVSPTKRLAMQNRPFTSVLPRANCIQSQTISSADIPREIIANDMSTVRSQYSPKDIRSSLQLDSPDTKGRRYSSPSLLGRLSIGTSKPRNTTHSRPNCYEASKVSRVADKLSKVSNKASKEIGISRNPLGPVVQQKNVTRRENTATTITLKGSSARTDNYVQNPSECSRQFKLCELYSTLRQVTLPRNPNIPQQSSERGNGFRDIAKRVTKGIDLVVGKLSPRINDSCSTPRTLFNDRRIRRRVGCSAGRSQCVRSVDRSGEKFTLQSKRDDCNSQSSTDFLSTTEPLHNSCTIRQQDRGSVSSTRRGNQISLLDGADKAYILSPGEAQHSRRSSSYPGQIQLPRRPSFSSSCSTRMAPTSPGHRESVPEVRSSPDRPVRVGTSEGGHELCVPRPEGPPSYVSRCLFPGVEFSHSMDIPTAVSYSESPRTSEPCTRNLPPGSSSLGTSVLETRSEGASSSTTLHHKESSTSSNRHGNRPTTSQSAGDGNRSVEMWGWAQSLRDWNEDQIQLLQASWRPSTRKTYTAAWKRWLKWSEQQGINPLAPSGQILARYLADLHIVDGLAYNTINVHKSVVATLTNPSNVSSLSSHSLVCHVLKAIALQKPITQRKVIWDIDVLTTYLRNSTVDETSVFAVSRQTATLLLICSGRRVHDLTLLATDSQHYSEENDSLILWPIFGSKTDTATYRQSGWRLHSNIESKNLDPVFWVKLCKTLLQERRQQSGIPNLFLNIRGPPKAASRTLIAGWVKSLLIEAGVITTPGSLRSAVASKRWENNCPLDDILSGGNWRSKATFTRFYCKEVMPRASNGDVISLFNSV